MEEEEYMSSSRNAMFVGKPLGQIHKLYISGAIRQPEEYIDMFEVIRNAGEQDMIYLHINSEGGSLFTAIQFLRVLGETKAMVVASVEGLCMSAATIIFMAAKNHEITNHSMFMFHNYSNKVEGKGGELFDHIVHARTWGEKLLRDVYASFLTEAEIQIILDGKDLYMTSEEVAQRLEKRNADIQRLAESKTVAVEEPKKRVRKKKVLISHRDGVSA